MGLGSGLLFTVLPLLKLGDIAPNTILSDDIPRFPVRRFQSFGVTICGLFLFFLLAWAQIGRAVLALQYVGILAGLIVVGGGLVTVAMGALR